LGMPFPRADIRDPEDFQAMAKEISIENDYCDQEFDEVYAHNVGRNQEEFMRLYGECVIPELHRLEKG
jgi:coenzyme F420-dependent glucose-6-phosphate dehydrogenase